MIVNQLLDQEALEARPQIGSIVDIAVVGCQRRDISQDQRYLLWKECAEKSGAWVRAQEAAKQSANAKRSEATKKRERNEDGTLTSAPTSSGDTGSKEKTGKNPGADAKAKSSKTNRGTVERMDKLSLNARVTESQTVARSFACPVPN